MIKRKNLKEPEQKKTPHTKKPEKKIIADILSDYIYRGYQKYVHILRKEKELY